MSAHPHQRPIQGMVFGFIGVLTFSLTLPATRLAVATLDPMIVGLGRSFIAACLAAPLLFFTQQMLPTSLQLRSLGLVILGVVFGFPALTAWAMHRVDASHGAVVLGLLPLATAIAGFLRAHDRPSFGFWCASMVGSFSVIVFALSSGGGSFTMADLALLIAVALAALGYAEGGRLGREMGGWKVICWALVLSVPLLLPIVGWAVWKHGLEATPTSWAGFAYVSVFSAFLGFFAWYHALSVGGVARVSQIQLLQPFLTLAFSASFLGEHLTLGAILSAIMVASSIVLSRRSKVELKPLVVALPSAVNLH